MDFLRNLMRYIFPGIIIILGIMILAGSGEQSSMYKIAGFAILVSGALSALMVANILSNKMNVILQFVVLLAAAYFVYQDYTSVGDEIRFAKKKKKIEAEVISRLKDIRTAQLAYRAKYGKFQGHTDSLVMFVKYDSLPEIRAIGEKPDTLTEAEALEMGIISRDTFLVSVIESKFTDPRLLEKRKFPFDPDEMVIAPYSKKPFVMQAGFIEVSGLQKAVFEAKDSDPFAQPGLKVGSMTEANTNGSWKE